MSQRPRHVILTNCEALNGGDAAILLAIVSLIRKAWPGVRLTLMARDAGIAARLYPEFEWQDVLSATPLLRPMIQKRWLSRLLDALATATASWDTTPLASRLETLPLGLRVFGKQLLAAAAPQLEAYRDADMVISTGGTYLVARYNLEPRIVEFLLAKLHHLPLVLYTQSIGKLAGTTWAKPVHGCLDYARLVLVRDAQSRDNLAALGFDTSEEAEPAIRQHADVVFALAQPETLVAAAQRQLPNRGLSVCISVRPWTEFHAGTATDGMARYTEAVAALCTHLVTRYDASIEFVSTCQGTEGYSRDDSSVAMTIADSLPHAIRQRVGVDRMFHTPSELIERLGRADVVVATRMHMAILSLCAGTPVLPIEYEFKTRELFANLGFERWVQDIQTVTSSNLVSAFDSFAGELDSHRQGLMDAVTTQRQSACDSFDSVCELTGYASASASAEAE